MTAYLLRRFAGRPMQGVVAMRVLRAYRDALEVLRLEERSGDIAALQLQFTCRQTGVDETIARAIISELFCSVPLNFLPECTQLGLREFLSAARKAKVGLGIVSDYPPSAKIQALGLEEFFPVVVSAGCPPVQKLKPHPLALTLCIERLQVDPAEVIYVGDRPDVDVPCALRAGVFPVLIGANKRSHCSVSGYTELTRLCRQAWSQTGVLLV